MAEPVRRRAGPSAAVSLRRVVAWGLGWGPGILLLLALCLPTAWGREAPPADDNPALEARVMAVAAELRCLVCQNQTIADSHADLAVDLRNQIRDMLAKGMSERQVHTYMTDRYGDFVLYRPPFKPTTVLLWLGPAALLALALGTLALVLRRRQRLAADAFDPDTPDNDADLDDRDDTHR